MSADVIVDVTDGIEKQIAAVIRHESQVGGLNVPPGETIGDRIRKGAAGCADGYPFAYGAQFRRLIARS